MTQIQLADILAIDVEASGLHVGSYPVQLAWASLNLEASTCLVRRPESWTDNDWNEASEAIHGISRARLQTEGLDVQEVGQLWLSATAGKHLVSDNPHHDLMWISRLLVEIGCEEPPHIWDTETILRSIVQSQHLTAISVHRAIMQAREAHPHTHDAKADAIRLAAILKGVSELPTNDVRS